MKLWYLSSFFRHEAPQAGRYRQFWQVGAEAIGSDDPAVDAESIVLLADAARRARRRASVRLRLASLGTPETRAAYREELQAYLRAHEDQLSEEVRGAHRRSTRCARSTPTTPARSEVMAGAPLLLDRLDGEDAEHFAEVARAARRRRASPTRSTRRSCAGSTTTRARSSSSRTDALGAQTGVGGGGRYDGLIEQLGGPATPGVGWAAGIERMLLAAERARRGRRRLSTCSSRTRRRRARATAFALAAEARRAGLAAQLELARALAEGPAQAGRPGRRALRCDPRRRGSDAEGHGDRASRTSVDAGRRGRRACCAGRRLREAAARERLPRRLVRRADRRAAPDATARVAGWVHRRRDHGGLIFIDLRDRSGIVQLVFHPGHARRGARRPRSAALRARRLTRRRRRSCAREEGNVNPNLPTGEIELRGRRDGRCSPTPRRRRSRSTRTASRSTRCCACATARSTCAAAPMQEALALRHAIIKTMRDVLDDRDFLEIETPILTRSTPEGARDFLVPGAHAARARSTRCRSRRSCSSSC